MKLSFLTVTHAAEFPQLYFQAKSLALFIEPESVDEIVIVLNERIGITASELLVRVRPYYGRLAPLVKVLSWSELDPDLPWVMGWHSQQVCKLLAASKMTGAICIILDSKNFFVRPLTTSTFVDADGRLKSFSDTQGGLAPEIYKRSLAYFGVQADAYAHSTLPNITPIPVRPSTIKKLIEHVEAQESASFASMFLAEGNRFAEFYLLTGYILARDGGFEREYALGKSCVVTFFHDRVVSSENFASCMWQLAQEHVVASGIHHLSRGILSQGQKAQLTTFLKDQGLDPEIADGSEIY